jgi:hypothetical protein
MAHFLKSNPFHLHSRLNHDTLRLGISEYKNGDRNSCRRPHVRIKILAYPQPAPMPAHPALCVRVLYREMSVPWK